MNWTGGSLQRTRKSNGGTLQQQKAYFAKARTHLQNVTSSQVAPFRPSYLQANKSDELMGELLLREAGSSRHKGHAPKGDWRGLRAPSGHSQGGKHGEDVSRKALVSFHPVLPSIVATDYADGDVQEINRSKRSIAEVDPECELLEANKKRLLKRPDWIGVNPSKPVGLPFAQSKEKHRIGKRRKTEIKPGVAARRTVTTNNFANRRLQNDEPMEGPRSGVRRDDLDNLRIRIGTDALTSAYSTQEHGCRRSQESSESMLFEQETLDAGTGYVEEVVQPVNHWPDTTSSAFQQKHAVPCVHSITNDHSRRHSHFDRYESRSPSLETCEQHGLGEEQVNGPTISGIHRRSKSIAPGCTLIHHTRGAHQPLRLVFSDPISTEDSDYQKHTSNPCTQSPEDVQPSSHVPLLDNTAQAQELHRPWRKGDRSSSKNSPATRMIVDAKAWELFLAIPNGDSAHSVAATESESSILRRRPTLQDDSEAVAPWSQLATRGDQTHVSSSVISASLPSVGRGMGQRALTDASDPDRGRLGDSTRKRPRALGDDEKLWQAFVFGSDDCPSTQTTQEGRYLRVPSNEPGTSPCMSLSAAVSSLHSPSRIPSTIRVCSKHDSTQHATAVQEPSLPREHSSPVVQKSAEESSDGELSRTFAQHSSSLLNNASCDTSLDRARTLSGTRTVGRSLQHARSSSRTRASPNRHDFRHSYSSMQAIPRSDSSDDALHLVDPDMEE